MVGVEAGDRSEMLLFVFGAAGCLVVLFLGRGYYFFLLLLLLPKLLLLVLLVVV